MKIGASVQSKRLSGMPDDPEFNDLSRPRRPIYCSSSTLPLVLIRFILIQRLKRAKSWGLLMMTFWTCRVDPVAVIPTARFVDSRARYWITALLMFPLIPSALNESSACVGVLPPNGSDVVLSCWPAHTSRTSGACSLLM